MPDTATGQAIPVTPDPAERERTARTALTAHKETCAPCKDQVPCTRLDALRAAWRQALRHVPLNHAPAGGQAATTTGASQ